MRLLTVFSVVLLTFSRLAFSADAAVEKSNISPANMALGKTLLGLIVVTGLIYGLAWCVKKFSNGNFMQQNGMRILSAMPLGAREKAVLLEVENKKILLGVSPGGISRLHVFEETPASEETLPLTRVDENKGEGKNDATEINVSQVISKPIQVKNKQDFSSYLKDVLNFSAGR